MNYLEETDRNYIIMNRKGEARYLRRHKKKCIGICLNDTKKYSFPQRSIDT